MLLTRKERYYHIKESQNLLIIDNINAGFHSFYKPIFNPKLTHHENDALLSLAFGMIGGKNVISKTES